MEIHEDNHGKYTKNSRSIQSVEINSIFFSFARFQISFYNNKLTV